MAAVPIFSDLIPICVIHIYFFVLFCRLKFIYQTKQLVEMSSMFLRSLENLDPFVFGGT